MSKISRRVAIYNPNFTNPYALEVAHAIAGEGICVTVWSAKSSQSVAPTNVRVRLVLAGESGTQSALGRLRDRVLGPLRVVMQTPREDVLIVAWVKDPWDAFVMTIRARLFRRTLFVHHNPPQIRGESRIARQERALMKVAPPIVHTERMLEIVGKEYPRAKLAAHPPYANMLRNSSIGRPPEQGPVAFVGALRADKGVHLIEEIARRTPLPWSIRFIGAGQIPAELRERLLAHDVAVENDERDYRPSDGRLISSLAECRALLAPYTAVTASGTMILSESLGLSVISLGLDSSSATDADLLDIELNRMAAELTTGGPREADLATRTLDEWLAEVRADWLRAIEEES